MRFMDGAFLRHCTKVAIGVSPECGRQYRELAGIEKKFEGYYAQFSGVDFKNMDPLRADASELNLLYVGRVEENKGVLDLVDMVTSLRARSIPVILDVCGSGAASHLLETKISSLGLGGQVRLRGKLLRPDLLEFYQAAHIVIVPTKSTFTEGLPMVIAEAALAGRVVITSKLSNALEVFQDAILEAKPDDVESYVKGIEMLFRDRGMLAQLGRLARKKSLMFEDPSKSLTSALFRVLVT